jgi:hypothetical protein
MRLGLLDTLCADWRERRGTGEVGVVGVAVRIDETGVLGRIFAALRAEEVCTRGLPAEDGVVALNRLVVGVFVVRGVLLAFSSCLSRARRIDSLVRLARVPEEELGVDCDETVLTPVGVPVN